MKFDKISIYFTIITIYSVVVVQSYRYLGILPSGAESHFIFGSALFKALAEEGHVVYVISAFPQEEPIENYYDVPFEAVKQNMEESTKIFDDGNKISPEYTAKMQMSAIVLSHPNVQKLMESNLKFDAVICERFFSEALFGFSEHFKAPLIILGVTGAIAWNMEMSGSPLPTSYVPNAFLPYSNRMSFMERVKNLAYYNAEYFFMHYHYLPRQNALYKKYFPDLEKDMYTVRKNAAVVLLNSHVSLDYPKPYVPNQIEVAGMHISSQRKPLPENIAKFIKDAKHGVIYFSLGSNLLDKNIPEAKMQEFFKAFKSLKQRVLCKYEYKSAEGVHDNILISKWFPQNDILADENVKAFITHGSLFSIIESAYHGKPIIGIPIFADQLANMARAENRGTAITLDIETLTAQDLVAAVEHIINNESYALHAKELSVRFRDQPVMPLNLSVYWAEHVVRQKGAKYLHCAGLDLSFFEYYSLDILFMPFLFIFSTVYVTCWGLIILYKWIKRQLL